MAARKDSVVINRDSRLGNRSLAEADRILVTHHRVVARKQGSAPSIQINCRCTVKAATAVVTMVTTTRDFICPNIRGNHCAKCLWSP